MMGRVGSVFVRDARRQLASRFRIERAYRVSTSTLAPMFFVKPTVVEMPTRSMQHLVSWNHPVHKDLSRAYSPFVHRMSTTAVQPAEQDSTPPEDKKITTVKFGSEDKFEKTTDVSSYWGVVPKVQFKEDGTPWKWTCFTPHETYYPDVSIDLEKHHDRKTYSDSIAYWMVKSMRIPADLFFGKRYDVRVMMLETVAAVPGMVGGMLLHCKSLRKFQNSGGWIKALLEEAENERMHLMTFMEVAQPKWWERALVFTVQGVFFNAYFLLYLVSPKIAHRITGYLEEEAVYSYTEFLKTIDDGSIPNTPAPAIAIDYWRLPKNASLRDVVMVVRADEAHHRDVNHFAADILSRGKELRESPAPVGYH